MSERLRRVYLARDERRIRAEVERKQKHLRVQRLAGRSWELKHNNYLK